jgi:hypothetical protein
LAAGIGIANAQTAAPMEAPAALNTVDFNFVGQANLGAPFRVVGRRSRSFPIVQTLGRGQYFPNCGNR